jgi:RND family efflux transporter MFP subunit
VVSSAAIHSLASEARARAESAVWAQFAAPKDAAEFCASWLAIVCGQIERVNTGLLVLGSDDSGYSTAAVWPDASRNVRHLGPAAVRTLKEKRGIVAAADGAALARQDQPAHVGYPIEVEQVLHGAVVLDVAPSPEQELQRALRLLHWGSAWLVDQFRRQAVVSRDKRIEQLVAVTDLVATSLQEQRFGASALALANEVAARLNCDRVSIGFEKSGSVEVRAISHTASFDRRTDLVRRIGDAMDEVLDLEVALVHPPQDADEIRAIAHGELAAECRDVGVCSAPLVSGGHAVGVITLERNHGERFDAEALELCRTIGLLLGPILEIKRENERGAWSRLRASAGNGARAVFGPGYPGMKLITLAVCAFAAFMSLVTGDYRVASQTVIEGAVQRAAVAPFEGFIADSYVRAGDTVTKGQVLCRLDDKELRLEQQRSVFDKQQAERKLRLAAATHDRASLGIVAAQIGQAQARLSLVEEKLSRASVIAPFDGVVVSGDLSQQVGSPVEQGKVLFQIAPLDAYRVILNVDERDIAEIRRGQRGELALSGIPYEPLRFEVTQVTPISTSQDGRNFFRVEARIDGATERLRPGMQGIGKVFVGERKLIWIWTRSLVDWLRLWAWTWLP